jgi:hypothetical protein
MLNIIGRRSVSRMLATMVSDRRPFWCTTVSRTSLLPSGVQLKFRSYNTQIIPRASSLRDLKFYYSNKVLRDAYVTPQSLTKSRSKLCYDRRLVGQCLVSSPHLGHKIGVLLLSDSCGFVHVGRPLWRDDGSVVHNYSWALPALSFSGLSPAGLRTLFYCLRFETPQPGGPGPRIYIAQEQGGPVIPPGTAFPFRRLIRLAGLRWRYQTRLHQIRVKVTLLLAVYRPSVRLGGKPLGTHDQRLFPTEP